MAKVQRSIAREIAMERIADDNAIRHQQRKERGDPILCAWCGRVSDRGFIQCCRECSGLTKRKGTQ